MTEETEPEKPDIADVKIMASVKMVNTGKYNAATTITRNLDPVQSVLVYTTEHTPSYQI